MSVNKHFFTIIIILVLGSYSFFASAMSSPGYKIQSDSINIGGIKENSASYKMDETIGESGTGESASASYKLQAGYQAMQEVYLSVSSPSDVVMSPAIGGVTGGTGNGSASWTIVTDDPAGYSLSIKAGASPALQSGANSFADYIPAIAGTPDYYWTMAATNAEFGFAPKGNNSIVQKFKDNGSACNAGSNVTDNKCWYNFSTADETIVNSSSANQQAGGEVTTVNFRAGSGSSHLQVAGTYAATITATAVAN